MIEANFKQLLEKQNLKFGEKFLENFRNPLRKILKKFEETFTSILKKNCTDTKIQIQRLQNFEKL